MQENPNITKTHFGVYGIFKEDKKILLIKKAITGTDKTPKAKRTASHQTITPWVITL